MLDQTQKHGDKKKHLTPAQILAIGFFCIIFIGGTLLTLPVASADGKSIGAVNAYFTATSAVCVTGLVTVDTGTSYSLFGQVIILLLIQAGGLGFMTMATLVFMLIGKRINLRERLTIQESLNEDSLAGLVRLVRNVVVVTFLFEAMGALLLSSRFIPIYGFGKGLWMGVFHSISAFCNAGFDLIGGFRSLVPFVGDPVINFTIMGLIVFGGLGFMVIIEIYRKRSYKKLSLNSRLVLLMSAGLLLLGFIFFFFVEYSNPKTLGPLPWWQKIMAAMFQSVTPRTAGYNTVDQAALTPASVLMTILLMFVGASPASTGGGIKTTTAAVILLSVRSVIRGREEVEFNRRRLPTGLHRRAVAIFLISALLVIVITIALMLIERKDNFPFENILFEVVSAFGTVGLSRGITPELAIPSKLLIMLTMFAGRVGPLTITLALAQRMAAGNKGIKYPEEKVMVG